LNTLNDGFVHNVLLFLVLVFVRRLIPELDDLRTDTMQDVQGLINGNEGWNFRTGSKVQVRLNGFLGGN
jgi:hypothetical protein